MSHTGYPWAIVREVDFNTSVCKGSTVYSNCWHWWSWPSLQLLVICSWSRWNQNIQVAVMRYLVGSLRAKGLFSTCVQTCSMLYSFFGRPSRTHLIHIGQPNQWSVVGSTLICFWSYKIQYQSLSQGWGWLKAKWFKDSLGRWGYVLLSFVHDSRFCGHPAYAHMVCCQ